jgi:hypothetical protein
VGARPRRRPALGHPRQQLEHHAVREPGRDVHRLVVVGCHLDDVGAEHVRLAAEPAHRVEQLTRLQAARLGGPGPGAARVDHVDVDRHEHPGGVTRRRPADGVVDDGVEPAAHALLHRPRAHPPVTHPGDDVRRRPVAAQTDLHEPVAGDGAGLDESAHRGAVAVEVAVVALAGVGVRVEVHERDPPSPCARATPVASAKVTVWSPPSTTGIAPAAATPAPAR